MSLPRLSLLFATLLLAMAPARAFQTADPNFKGLPTGGGLDPQKITEQRYGNAPAQPAAGLPAAAAPYVGGPDADPAAPQQAAPKQAATAAPPAAASPPESPAPQARAPITGALATLWLERSGDGQDGGQVPLTFGQVFAPGVLARETRLGGRLADGKRVALQVDVKALHPDGSVRHAIISGILPAPGARPLALGLVKLDKPGDAAPAPAAPADPTPAALLKSGLRAGVRITIDGKQYEAALEQLLARGKPATWLDGPIVHEWMVDAPLAARNGQQHPHLAARYAVRWYPALKKARVDVTLENNWAWEPNPQGFTYDAEIDVGGKTVYRKAGLTHFHHARWRQVAWWGDAPAIHLRHDSRQLIASRALPNYDPAVQVSDGALSRMFARWTGPKTEPMGVGMALPGMRTTGGRPDIGLLPGWAAMYLIGMDPRAAAMTMGTADLAGSWSIHYRDRASGTVSSLLDDVGKRSAKFPACTGREQCSRAGEFDKAHQPGFSYLPYLLSGDYYHLEELQFWAMFNMNSENPKQRQQRLGNLQSAEVRGQAWSMRSLAQAAYITPDNHPLKSHFLQILDRNLDWYIAEYPANPAANKLGIIANGYAVNYRGGTGVAPWQQDFFTAAIGMTADMGFVKARRLLEWNARFAVSRMVGEGSCWVDAAMYSMKVRDTPKSPFYGNIGQAFRASAAPGTEDLACESGAQAAALKVRQGEMTGYSSSNAGYPSNMQPALAYAADAMGEPGRKAWQRFMARSGKPDYSGGPQFAIVPRGD